MQKAFHGREQMVPPSQLTTGKFKLYTKITFVRPPLDRFMSSYEEVFIRHAPWEPGRKVPPQFDVFGKGLKSYSDYQAVFCPPSLKLDIKTCTFGPTHEDGSLLAGFERFVEAYDGLTVFDVHLKLQSALLSYDNGDPVGVDVLLNTSRAHEGWVKIGSEHGIDNMEPFMVRGRAYPRRFNVSGVSDATKRKICRLQALDYCCMNFKLPPVCTNAGVFCNVTLRNNEPRIVPHLEASH